MMNDLIPYDVEMVLRKLMHQECMARYRKDILNILINDSTLYQHLYMIKQYTNKDYNPVKPIRN